MQGYTDVDLDACLDSRKNTTVYVFILGGKVVNWMLRLQMSVAFSTTEAKYMAILEAVNKLTGQKTFLGQLGKEQLNCTLFSKRQSVIHLVKNPVFHARTKHIQLRYHFIIELVDEGTLSLRKVPGSSNSSDKLTKAVCIEKLTLCTALSIILFY